MSLMVCENVAWSKGCKKMVPNLAELKMEVDACFLAGETEKTISLIEEIYAVCDEWMAIPPYPENKCPD